MNLLRSSLITILFCSATQAWGQSALRLIASDIAPIVTSTNSFGPAEVEFERAADEPATLGARFICRGTKPFWTLKIEQNRMSLDLTTAGVTEYSAPTTAQSSNSASSVINYFGTTKDGTKLIATIVNARLNGAQSCHDGMSGEEYDFSVYVTDRGNVYDGCCWIER